MDQKTVEFNQAKGKMVSDIKTVITDGEDLLKSAAHVSGAGYAVVREKIDQKVGSARRTATMANNYVHGNPWVVLGVAVAGSVLIGYLAARRQAHSQGDVDASSAHH